MKVGFVQIDCRFGEKEKNIQRAAEMISRQPADLWVLPELFNTGYQFVSKREAADLAEPVPAGPTTEKLIALAKEHQTHFVAGLAERHGKAIYNASVLVGPKGFISVYRKIHLFYEEKRWFTPGNLPFQVHSISPPRLGKVGAGDIRVGKVRVGMMICFDWVFPEAARSLALLGADLIAHPSNLVLPYCPDAMPTRCIENRIFSVTANRVGVESRGRGAGEKETLTFIGQS
ncbi:MAG: nitrilase-related carbon-nitrogen hydrolase [Candidatus Manganitrophaceae bacterium]